MKIPAHAAVWLAYVLCATDATAQNASAPHPATLVSGNAIEAHVRFLSDDALEGRAPGTRGERAAAAYIGAQFKRFGFEPAGDSGRYTKSFTLLRYTPAGSTTAPGALEFGRDFVARAPNADANVDLAAEAVFVGYGVVAPHYGRDDYGNTDVRGRVVIALAGNPLAIDSSKTLGSYYGEENYKKDEARRRGAAALLLVSDPARAVAWDSLTRRYHEPAWLIADMHDALRLTGLINPQRVDELAKAKGTSLARLAADARKPSFKPRALGTVHLAVRGDVQSRLDAMNVVACLPGTGANANERVFIGAHYDAYGIGRPVAGDSIYNGALDNASGTAVMLAAAEAIAASGVRPPRSLCFIAFGAEERGLLGSQAYAAQLQDPSTIIAMLNIDGANLWGATRDIAVLGHDQSTLGDVFTRAAAAEGLSVTVHPIEVRQRFYFRSDHISFARAGVPSLFVRRGKELVNGGPARWQQLFDEYYGTDYHKPSDEMRSWYVTDGGVQQARVLVRTMLEVANTAARPTWLPASDFYSTSVRKVIE